ncbi:MAG: hypothetical protein IJK89_13195 [Clostridia bacterium]|nr:hypothetical protein [Clostridia bacterium]
MSEDIKKENPLGEEAAETGEAAAEVAEEAAEAAEEIAAEAAEVAEEAAEVAEEAAEVAEEAAEEAVDPALEGELEQLRDTFQEKYDETVEEAAAGPVIQELEAHTAYAEEDADEADEEAEEAAAPAKKKKRRGLKAFIAVIVILAVLVFGVLIAYFVMSVSNPNFNSLISSLAAASSAQTYEDKLDAYQEALTYCDGESAMQQGMKEYIVDEILKAAYQEKGFSEAQTLMTQYLTEEQIAASRSKTVKTIKKVIAAADEIADGSLDAVFAALAENADADVDAVAAKFSVPAELSDAVKAALDDELKAVAALKTASGIDSATSAIELLQSAYSSWTAAGADKEDLAEKMAVSLYKNGYPFAAMTVANALADSEAEPLNQEYSDMLADVGDFSGVEVSVYALAAKAADEGRTDYAALVTEACEVSEAKAALLGDLVGFCAGAIAAESEKNFSLAASAYASTHSVVDALGIKDDKLVVKTVNALIESGNFSQLQSYDAVLTDDFIAGLSVKDAAQAERARQIYNALNAASGVFSEYYMNYAYYGQEIDYEAACADLDALLNENSNNYDRGFVAYCKYFAAVYSGNEDEYGKYVDEMKATMPELKSVYGYYEIDMLKEDGRYDEAKAVAESILDTNVGDDYANATVAFVKRTGGDVAGALEAAVKGIALSGTETFCANEAAVDYMLTGDFESAFGYLKNMYRSSPSIESCDMLLIFNALYDGDNKDVKEDLAALVEEIEQTYASYQVSSLSDTTAIINGEKTLEDVFCAGTFGLANDAAAEEPTETAE